MSRRVLDPTFHRTDLGNAGRLAKWFGQDLRYCSAFGWFVWDGSRWAEDRTGRVMSLAKQTVCTIYTSASRIPEDDERKAFKQFALESESRSRLEAMIALAKTEPDIPITPEALDADPWLLNVKNGTLDLRTEKLYSARREDFITRQAPVIYDPQAECPAWLAFLSQILQGDLEQITFLQRAIGHALSGDTREQLLFILHGDGANGKSTFLNILSRLFGEYGATTPAETLLVKKGEGPRNDLARLKGIRFVAAIETEQDKRLAEALVKQVTGGDRIAARFLYKEIFEYDPEFKIFLAANHVPIIRGGDHAIWRRLRLLPFKVVFQEKDQDKALKSKLAAELPGILRWAVVGCLAWQQEGIGLPPAVEEATAEYRAEMDTFTKFLKECCEQDQKGETSAKSLYEAYARWCDDLGVAFPVTKKEVGRRLRGLGCEARKGTAGARIWRGIRLVSGTSDVSGLDSITSPHMRGKSPVTEVGPLTPHLPLPSADPHGPWG